MPSLARRFFALTGPVSRSQYLLTGLGLMALKYAVDVAVYRLVLGGWWHPLEYLNPVYSMRMASAPVPGRLPPMYTVFLLLWGLLFAWIGSTWSARRAVDAGAKGWLGVLFIVPIINYLLILVLVLMPTRPRKWGDDSVREAKQMDALKTSHAIIAGLSFLGLMTILYGAIVQGAGSYGMVAFVSMPLVYGLGLGYQLSRMNMNGMGQTLGFAFASALIACLALLLFALEGLVCIVMAFPVVVVAILAGAILGRTLVGLGRPGVRTPLCLMMALPLSAWFDSKIEPTPARMVTTSIEVDAPMSEVWKNVVQFSELPKPEGWLFKTGIAYPLRARIEGQGVGAIRYCEFSTGAFVEPITVWEEPTRLGFDVIEQPLPMEEWSFYADLRPPHLEKSFRSVRGEFRLSALPGGRTLLEGSTWYELQMAPEMYWQLWSDAIVQRIHGRVLRHVKFLSEH